MKLLTSYVSRAILVSLTVGLGAVGCSNSQDDVQASQVAGEGTFDPRPSDPSSIEAQLKRFPGQTQFLSPLSRYFGFGRSAADSAESASAEGGRAIQESDIFKIGKPGEKLLFLLNNYRGLQVVSFEDGADEPKLIGRVEATGNWPTDMYYDAAHDRLIVLENNYSDNDGNYYDYSELQSRLVVYDVANPAVPKITTTLDIQGTLADSRLVGEILYVATSVRPSYGNDDQKATGHVHSFRLGSEVSTVESLTLSSPVSYRENMNIVETEEDGSRKYYLIAVLSQDVWSWWNSKSVIEVVDISDAEGKIRPVMQVTAKGNVDERSQTFIKNSALIVASNYVSENADVLRVAVESFAFPTEGQLISENEATYRKLHIDRAVTAKRAVLVQEGLSGDALEEAIAAYRLELLKDSELGLYGRLVDRGEGNAPLKLMPEQLVTIGDSRGQSASVQDVRVSGDNLYVFWVPRDNIDPLDVIDISNPTESLAHLAHLEFEGWIQRALPLQYAGREFIIGLGWIVPTVNNENNRRYPQVSLFEIKRTGSRARAELVVQETLTSGNVWTNFQAQDKEIEFRFQSENAGVIMYSFYGWSRDGYVSGGKLVGFDLANVDANPDAVFNEGGILVGSEGWLRRVFTNPEIDRINTFADVALGVFDVEGDVGSAERTIEAVKVLELARNLRSYVDLSVNGVTYGVQVISEYSWNGNGKTELRVVDAKKADAELPAVLSTLSLEGSYVAHLVDGDRLLVLTNNSRYLNETWTEESRLAVVKIDAANASLVLSANNSWNVERAVDNPFTYQRGLRKLASGEVVVLGPALKLVDTNNLLDLGLDGCSFAGSHNVTLVTFGGRSLASYSVNVNDPSEENLVYTRPYVASVSVVDNALVCGTAINVPGAPILVRDGHIVTEDTRLIEVVTRGEGEHTYRDVVTEDAVASLALSETTATLVDLYDPKNVNPETMQVVGDDRLVFVESSSQTYRYGWMQDFAISRPYYPRSTYNHKFVYLGFDDELRFAKASYSAFESSARAPQVNAVLPALNDSEDAAVVVTQGNQLLVLGLNDMERPTKKQIAKVGMDFTVGEFSDSVRLSGYARYWLDQDTINFTESTKTLEVADGHFGVTQIVIQQ